MRALRCAVAQTKAVQIRKGQAARSRICCPSNRGEAAVAHRSERLIGLANELVRHWTMGSKQGPTDEVMKAIDSCVDNSIKVRTTHLTGSFEGKGLEGVRDKLTLDQHREGAMRPKQVVMCAASEDDDCVFCLLECEEVTKAGEGKEPHGNYGIVKFDIMCDDTVLLVTGINERCQLGPVDAALLSVHRPKDEHAVKLAGVLHFPSDHVHELHKEGLMSIACDSSLVNSKHAMEGWVLARCTGQDETQLLERVLDKKSYRLWDAYGVLPLLCGITASGSESTDPSSCVMQDAGTLMQMIKESKAKFHIECSLLDCAVCTTHNIGFSHWRSSIRPIDANSTGVNPGNDFIAEGEEVIVECMEMHVFNEEGFIMDTWMMRDAMPEEQSMLQAAMKP